MPGIPDGLRSGMVLPGCNRALARHVSPRITSAGPFRDGGAPAPLPSAAHRVAAVLPHGAGSARVWENGARQGVPHGRHVGRLDAKAVCDTV